MLTAFVVEAHLVIADRKPALPPAVGGSKFPISTDQCSCLSTIAAAHRNLGLRLPSWLSPISDSDLNRVQNIFTADFCFQKGARFLRVAPAFLAFVLAGR
jgi:hypothetical protein